MVYGERTETEFLGCRSDSKSLEGSCWWKSYPADKCDMVKNDNAQRLKQLAKAAISGGTLRSYLY